MKRIVTRYFLALMAVMVAGVSIGQEKKIIIKGEIKDAKTGVYIRNASIRNLYTGSTMMSRGDGKFTIGTAPQHILSFSASGYFTDTLTVTDSVLSLDLLQIRLRILPATLPEVVITAHLNPYQVDSILRRKDFLELVGDREVPTVSKANSMGFGIGINLDRFSKKERNRRAARNLFDITEEDAYINYRWSDSLVNRYTRFTGDELTEFMQAYRPEWLWLREHTSDSDMMHYINRALKKRRKTLQ